jgi:hypothetical protein
MTASRAVHPPATRLRHYWDDQVAANDCSEANLLSVQPLGIPLQGWASAFAYITESHPQSTDTSLCVRCGMRLSQGRQRCRSEVHSML